METASEKKKLKRLKLMDAGYDLFITKGINNTVIDDIVKKAGGAKGTFYLYFKDKYDLVNQITLHKSLFVIREALRELEERRKQEAMDFEKEILFFIDYLVEFFQGHKDMLKLIRKNFSAKLLCGDSISDPDLQKAVDAFTQNFMNKGETLQQAQQTLYIIVAMVGSVCCDAILEEEPYSLSQIKPTLYFLIRKLLC